MLFQKRKRLSIHLYRKRGYYPLWWKVTSRKEQIHVGERHWHKIPVDQQDKVNYGGTSGIYISYET